MSDNTIAVREGEGFDAARVLEHLRAQIPGIPAGELEVRQFPTGASNLTYLLRVGGWGAVLRRPPLGPVPPRAHDMEREGRLLQRLNAVFPLAPRPLLICTDAGVIGAPFTVMEYRPGIVVDARLPKGTEATPELGRMMAESVVDTLVELHGVDYRAAGLEEMGRPEGFMQRQVDGWIGRYEKAVTDEIAEVEPLIRRIREGVPDTGAAGATVIHNDFKLNNLIFDPADLGRVTAVVDWEMATVGDPLFDLAIFLSYWIDSADPPDMQALVPSVTSLPQFPGRDALREMYAAKSGRDLSGLDWYMTFSYFKLAVILQQIYARYVRGQTRDPRFAGFGHAVRTLIVHAHGLGR
ncbi:MAG TPA: phosphotransferase family protein [Longimicrobium sp.]